MNVIVLLLLFYGFVSSSKIHWRLERSLVENDEPNAVFVSMDNTLLHRHLRTTSSNRIVDIVSILKQHALTTLSVVLTVIPNTISFKMFWISNELFIPKASSTLIRTLASIDCVKEIRHETQARLPELSVTSYPGIYEEEYTSRDELGDELEDCTITTGSSWAPKKIGADILWQKNITGEGIIVASIDSGVRGSHKILRDQYLGKYGWLDPADNSPEPNDPVGHGTLVMGVLAGSQGYGIAPGAKWMACRGCTSADSCPRNYLLKCAEYFTCPAIEEENCGPVPHVIVNSWFNDDESDYFDTAALAWKQAGITAVFAAGNSGDKCQSISSPAHLSSVISVGMSTPWDSLGHHSSLGPTRDGTIKPDLVAPGVGILSAASENDCDMGGASGTSMAAPVVGGSIALLLQAYPALSPDSIRRALIDSTVKKMEPHTLSCGNISSTTFPSHIYGYGRVDIERAVHIAAN